MSRTPFSIGVLVLGGGAVLGVLFIVVGYLLPTDFEARADRVVPLPAEAIFHFLDSPEGWQVWTPWPETGVERTGPPSGEGARLSWDDPELGSGSFTLTRVVPSERVDYQVEVGRSMRTEGTITLTRAAEGVRLEWVERGTLGRNPLMGYWALSMDRAQSQELAKGLERLEAAAAEEMPLRAPIDSASVGDDPQGR